MTPTLQGSLVTLRPLLKTDAPLLIDAAEDGELWSLPFTVVDYSRFLNSESKTNPHTMINTFFILASF